VFVLNIKKIQNKVLQLRQLPLQPSPFIIHTNLLWYKTYDTSFLVKSNIFLILS